MHDEVWPKCGPTYLLTHDLISLSFSCTHGRICAISHSRETGSSSVWWQASAFLVSQHKVQFLVSPWLPISSETVKGKVSSCVPWEHLAPAWIIATVQRRSVDATNYLQFWASQYFSEFVKNASFTSLIFTIVTITNHVYKLRNYGEG